MDGDGDEELTHYRKPSWSKGLACCSVAVPSLSDWLMRCHKGESEATRADRLAPARRPSGTSVFLSTWHVRVRVRYLGKYGKVRAVT